MDKETLKKIILEKLGSEKGETFSEFLKKVLEYLHDNQTLKLEEIGYFQLKKEPLSRMERRGEGNLSKKDIIVFLPTDGTNLISLEVESKNKIADEFNDSVFDIGVNKPTIISEANIEDEGAERKIIELIESGEILDNFDILENTSSHSANEKEKETEFETEFNTEEIIDNELKESFLEDDIPEVRINKDYLNDSVEDEFLKEENEDNNIEDDFAEISSDVETELADEDIFVPENDMVDTGDEEIAEDKNPFDELEEYIKDDNTDEAQEILNEVNEESADDEKKEEIAEPNVQEEEKKTETKFQSYSAIRNKQEKEWYKNPVLYIAVLGVILAVVVVFVFMPSSSQIATEEIAATEENQFKENIEQSKIDSLALSDSSKSSESGKSVVAERINKKLEEIKKNEAPQKKDKSEIIAKEKRVEKKATTPTGLYRDIPNDRSVTNRIYFDGERYTVQASSWRSTSIAEREVEKLRKRGFDAFIYKVFIKSKNGTWNRVRIGYFNTKEEAEDFLRKNKI